MWVISQFRHGTGPFDARLGINVGPAQNGGTLVVAWSRSDMPNTIPKLVYKKLCLLFATQRTVRHLSQNVGLVPKRNQALAQKTNKCSGRSTVQASWVQRRGFSHNGKITPLRFATLCIDGHLSLALSYEGFPACMGGGLVQSSRTS